MPAKIEKIVNMFDGEVHELRYGANHGGYASQLRPAAPEHERLHIPRPFEAFFGDIEFLREQGFQVDVVAPGVIRASYPQAA